MTRRGKFGGLSILLLGATALNGAPIADWKELNPNAAVVPITGADSSSPTFGDGSANSSQQAWIAARFGQADSPLTITLAVGQSLTVSGSVVLTGGTNNNNQFRFGIFNDTGKFALDDPNNWTGGWLHSSGSAASSDLYLGRTDGVFISTLGNAVAQGATKTRTGAFDGDSVEPFTFSMTITRASENTVDLVSRLAGGDGDLDEEFALEDVATTLFTYTTHGWLFGGTSGVDQAAFSDVEVTVSSPARPELQVSRNPDTGRLALRWTSQPGMLYTLRSAADPASAPPADWPVFDTKEGLEAMPPENQLELDLPADTARFFVVEEFPKPPVVAYSENFDGGDPGWTTGFGAADTQQNTRWERGDPTGGSPTGPPAARSGTNCYGTSVASDYGFSSDIWLRSPGTIDLTTATEATLVFQQFRDIEPLFDRGFVRVLRASDDSQLGPDLLDPTDGTGTAWEQAIVTLPAEALGEVVKLEFRFQSDDVGNQAGWYIDDVEVLLR